MDKQYKQFLAIFRLKTSCMKIATANKLAFVFCEYCKDKCGKSEVQILNRYILFTHPQYNISSILPQRQNTLFSIRISVHKLLWIIVLRMLPKFIYLRLKAVYRRKAFREILFLFL